MNVGMGCAYECSYCFLQAYQNIPGILIPFNIEDYLKEDKINAFRTKAPGLFGLARIGSGEFSDSLIFDDITGFSKRISDFFAARKDFIFEFKTKSVNIENLLSARAAQNLTVSWSVNSLKIAEENEFKAPPVPERIKAAAQCAKAGFSLGFHFDPVIYYEGWEKGYKETVDMLFDSIPNESVKWISLGALRMPAAQKQIMENRFPQNRILSGEMLLGNDYKLRYEKNMRIKIYGYLSALIKSKKSKCAVYLCMEEKEIWQASNIL
jgi:spore photoproduct lyase